MFCWPGFDFVKAELKNFQGNYLEIGVFNGDSLKQLAEQYTDKLLIGIDPFIEDGNTGHTSNVSRGQHMPVQKQNTLNNLAGLDNVYLYEMTSEEFYERLTDDVNEQLNICGVLIDGSHWYDDVKIDVKLALKVIGNKPGFIIFDDLHMEEVRRPYLEFCEEHKNIIRSQTVLIDNNTVIGVVIN